MFLIFNFFDIILLPIAKIQVFQTHHIGMYQIWFVLRLFFLKKLSYFCNKFHYFLSFVFQNLHIIAYNKHLLPLQKLHHNSFTPANSIINSSIPKELNFTFLLRIFHHYIIIENKCETNSLILVFVIKTSLTRSKCSSF